MIRVACDACGARFKAREEFAGRRGKCPNCGEPVLVPLPEEVEAEASADPEPEPGPPRRPAPARAAPPPASDDDDDLDDDEDSADEPDDDEAYQDEEDEEDEAPVAAPAPTRRRGAAGPRKRVGGSSRRRTAPASKSLAAGARLTGVKRRRSPLGTFLIIFAVAGIVVWGGLAYLDPSLEHQPYYGNGLELQGEGRYEEALEAFRQVPPGDGNYTRAQEKIAEIEAEKAARTRVADAKAADNLFSHVAYFEQRTLASYDPGDSFYPSYVRYFLKRGQEFLDNFPDHPRADDMRALLAPYEGIVSLDDPPSEGDVETELSFRLPSRQFRTCWQIVDEFEAAGAGRDEAARAMRATITEAVHEYWANLEGELREEALIPGEEDWRRVASRTLGFLDLVEGIPGVDDEARALHDRALQQLGG